MIELDLPASPLPDDWDRAAGRRLPNVVLRRQGPATVRPYDLLPAGPALLDLSSGAGTPGDLPVDATVPIRDDVSDDAVARLRTVVGRHARWVLVRPHLHVAGATADAGVLHAVAGRALAGDPGPRPATAG